MRFSIFSTARLRRHLHGWGYVGVTLLAFALLWALMPGLLAHPNDYFLERAGDGIQSYFATAFYALHDQGVRFSGMNYPYGEHINYPNLQPLIAWVIGFLQRHGVPAARYTIGITNAAALAGLLATPAVLYALLRRSRLPVGYSVLTALLIAFLSPQLLRLGPHTSLSYPFFVPLLWYFIVRMQEAPQAKRWYVWFVVSSLLMGGVMLYFTAAGSLLLLAHVAVLAWQRRQPGPLLWRMVVAALLPLLLLRGWLWLTDPIADRPPNPFGVLYYMATPRGVFMSNQSPFTAFWQAIWPLDPLGFEAQSYVGLVCTIVLAATVLAGIWYVGSTRRWRRLLRPALPAHLAAGLWAASIILVYALGYPFKWPWLTWTLDYSGPIKQFRALGRFAWPFYYVAGVYTAYYLYRLWRYQRLRRVPMRALPWLPLLLGVWAYEAWINVSVRAAAVTQATGASEFLSADVPLMQELTWKNRTAASFQAILPLPYFNKGSDAIDIDGSPGSVFNGEYLACATGLPLLATYVSRPSMGHMLSHVQLLSSPLIEKTLLRDFPNQKPLLLMVANDLPLSPAEQRLVSLAQPLVATPQLALYELPVAALAATTLAQEHATALALLPTLPERPNGLRCTTAKGALVQSFDQQPDRRSRIGTGGAFYEPTTTSSVLYDGPLPAPADTGRYEASVWINAGMAHGYGNIQVKTYVAGQQLGHLVADGRNATDISKGWVRVAVPFRLTPGIDRIEVLYFGREVLLDDLLIRPLDTDVYHYAGQGAARRLFKNTYSLQP